MNRMLIGLKMSEYVGTAGTVSEKDLIRAIPWKNSWLNIWNHQPVVPYITICWTILDIEIIGHVFCPSKKNPTVYIPSLYPILSQYCWLFIYSIYECAYYIYIHTYIPLKLLRRSHIYIFYIYIPWNLTAPGYWSDRLLQLRHLAWLSSGQPVSHPFLGASEFTLSLYIHRTR